MISRSDSQSKIIEAILKESEDTFEILDVKGMDKEKATKVIDEHYPHKLTYKGEEFFDKVYMNKLVPFAGRELGIGKTYKDSATGEMERIDGQESYLGYLPDDDVFVSGWDIFGDIGDTNVVFIKYEGSRSSVSTSHDVSADICDMMYGPNGSLKKLHKIYPSLIDIRLD